MQTAPLFGLEEGVGAEDLITEGRCLDEGGVAGKRVEGGADSLVGSLGVELDAGAISWRVAIDPTDGRRPASTGGGRRKAGVKRASPISDGHFFLAGAKHHKKSGENTN